MKKVIKLEKRMFNRGLDSSYNRVYVSDDWCSNGDWMIHNSKVNLDKLDKSTHIYFENKERNLTDEMVDGVRNQIVDESIRFYKTDGREEVDGRQCVLFSSVDDKKIRYIQLRYVRYFGLKTLYSKDTIEDYMLWFEDKKFFIMPVK